MNSRVHMRPHAREQLYRLPTGTYQRVRAAIEALGQGGLPLSGEEAAALTQPVRLYLVCDGYRVAYEVAAGGDQVYVLEIALRSTDSSPGQVA